MVLTSPTECERLGTKREHQALVKLHEHVELWGLCRQVMEEIDPDFACQYTSIAVTKNFKGSPHIDKQDVRLKQCCLPHHFCRKPETWRVPEMVAKI